MTGSEMSSIGDSNAQFDVTMPHIPAKPNVLIGIRTTDNLPLCCRIQPAWLLFITWFFGKGSRIFNADKFNMDKTDMSPTHIGHMTRQANRGAKKSGSHMAESVLRNQLPC